MHSRLFLPPLYLFLLEIRIVLVLTLKCNSVNCKIFIENANLFLSLVAPFMTRRQAVPPSKFNWIVVNEVTSSKHL